MGIRVSAENVRYSLKYVVAVVFLKDFMRTEYVAFAESPVAVQVRVVLLFAFKICVHLPPL